jgi:hypothetical protein
MKVILLLIYKLELFTKEDIREAKIIIKLIRKRVIVEEVDTLEKYY